MATAWPKKRRLIGTDIPRLDGPEKATGRAKYSFDINLPGMLHAKILRCPYAHAKVKAVDTTAAEKMPGVAAVHQIAKPGQELFYAGEEVIALAADTEEHMHDAIRAIKVEYDPLDFLVLEEDALKATNKRTVSGNAKQLNNLSPGGENTRGNVQDAYSKADGVVEGKYGVATVCHQCLESHGLVAHWTMDDQLTVYCSTQATVLTAQVLAQAFN